ncbi:MAG TPA: carboxypeptidase-like regulatory domain-containing protein, partial [Chryseosolibacter sp.]|nr:carboxypeptidase-like regulatory domain-containing protein [Chryseosolibacter sp.]
MKRKFTVHRTGVLLLLLFSCWTYDQVKAQAIAVSMIEASVAQNRHERVSDQRSLEDVLMELQEHYKISFIYESEVVANKLIFERIVYKPRVEATMAELLSPLGLKYKKINDRTYAISYDRKQAPADQSAPGKKNRAREESMNLVLPADPAIEVSGVVTDENDQPLPGVNVIERGTTNGTTTDADGHFTLQVTDANSPIVISFIGYESQEIVAGSRTQFSIKLSPAIESLQEVVVVGYGVQKKANLTGAVATVDAKDIEKLNVTQTSQLLTGQVAGVTVVQQSGQPGKEGLDIRIRGIGTFSGAGNNPLVLVDGLASSLDNVDFNDIASISVLKDAASASIYGARAANGVILIETKKGKEGKVSVNYHGYVGFEQ